MKRGIYGQVQALHLLGLGNPNDIANTYILLSSKASRWVTGSNLVVNGGYDKITYPDKVQLNYYYYRHYSFVKDIQMIFCAVLGRKMEYVGERI